MPLSQMHTALTHLLTHTHIHIHTLDFSPPVFLVQVRLLTNDCAAVLGLGRKFGPDCMLKTSPNYFSLVSSVRFNLSQCMPSS